MRTNDQIQVEIPGGGQHTDWSINRNAPLLGAVAELQRLFSAAKSEKARKKYRAFFCLTPCDACSGTGVGAAARNVTVNGWTYPQTADAVVEDLQTWSGGVLEGLNQIQRAVAVPLLNELNARIGSLARLGLGHVSLSRPVPTLSGGELQRVRLSAQLGSGLTGIVYVLDEPSSGLHPNDRDDLVDVLVDLRDRGNTVIVIEHDMDVVRRCDWVVDIGPAAGVHGGELVASGPPAEVAENPESVTGTYIAATGPARRSRPERPSPDEWLTLEHLSGNNIVDANVRLPLQRYTCITGVSGSGKSTLLGAIADALTATLKGSPTDVRIDGHKSITWVEQVTQAPIGRNARSNAATYTKLFDQIRRLFAATSEAIAAGLDESVFSFNSNSGRCEECAGNGKLIVDLHYLPSITTTCPACHGRRFQDHVLAITIADLSIADVLDLTIEQASSVDALTTKAITQMLGHLLDVGLGYLALGQPAPTLSGGEAQRLKLARLLARTTKTGNGLVILDEPTAGLHPTDTARIIDVIESLVQRGTTVLVADHQTATRSEADWLITTGPGAGPAGGQIIDQTPPN